MRLYFLRHADALEGVNDAARPLSPRGWKQARRLGRFLEEAGVSFDVAYSSPLVRACETAEAVLNVCGGTIAGKCKRVESLRNETSQKQFEAWLRSLPEANHVMLVGHAPSLPERVRVLLGIPEADTLRLPKGGLICLETEDARSASLKFFITPRLLGV